MQTSQWVVDGPTPSKAVKLKVIDYIEPIAISEDMQGGQRVFAENYNLMIATHLANKSMKSK